MKIKVILTALVIFFSSIFSTGITGAGFVDSPALPDQVKAQVFDPQAKILADYLAAHESPLQYHAQDFVNAAKAYGLDWKLLPAIAGVESTFGRFTPGGYNAWGWGVYGNQAVYFRSWKVGIYTVSRGLKEHYVDRGLTNPYSINRVYAKSPHWGGKVTYFMKDLEKFAARYEAKQKQLSQAPEAPKIAAISGQLALR